MLVIAAIDIITLVPFAVFGAIAAAVWWFMDTMSTKAPRSEQRLEELKDPSIRKRREAKSLTTSETSAMAKVLEKASPALAKPLQPKNEVEAGKLKLRLSFAGFRDESATTIFLGLKIAFLLTGLVVSSGRLVTVSELDQQAIFSVILTAGGLFYLPDIVLWFLAKKRKESIFLGLPDALDLLVVCVEAGLGLDQAMRKVADEMKKSHRIIADEFALCNFQIQMGRTRTDVLRELGERTGVDDLRSLAAIIIQADKFGSSIAHALRVQSDSMRTRRSQMAEEKAAKTAVKLIFPLVLFIFPGIFVVLVGPAAINVINEMLPMMGGK